MVGPGDAGEAVAPNKAAGAHAASHPARMSTRAPRVDTVIAQAGGVALGICPGRGANHGDTTGSVIPPIYPSTTYARDPETYLPRPLMGAARVPNRVVATAIDAPAPNRREGADDDRPGRFTTLESAPAHPGKNVYARPDNPTYVQAEAVIAALDGGVGCALFSSGMAAACGLATALLKHGDRCVFPRHSYFACREYFRQHCARIGCEFRLYDCRKGKLHEHLNEGADPRTDEELWRTEGSSVETAIGTDGKTKLVWIETPANPTWDVTDVRRVCDRAHAFGASVCVDNTVLTPLCCAPIRLGADFVMHSATKYLNGHSDVVAGAVVAAVDDERWGAVKSARAMNGGILGSFEAWLLLRGMRTLHVRVRRQCESASYLAKRLASHKNVSHCLYQGLASHPGHDVATAQSTDGVSFGGMMSIRVKGGADAAKSVCGLCKIWVPATSLGGVESLIEHRATLEGGCLGGDSGVPDDLLRLSVGLEDPEDLWIDLKEALEGKKRKDSDYFPDLAGAKPDAAAAAAAEFDRKRKAESCAIAGKRGHYKDRVRVTVDGVEAPVGNVCRRGCAGLDVPVSDKSVHAKVKGVSYCARSDGAFPDWLRARFPGISLDDVEAAVAARPKLRWGERLPPATANGGGGVDEFVVRGCLITAVRLDSPCNESADDRARRFETHRTPCTEGR